MKQVLWVLLLIPLLQACATHAPMSEMVMFTPKKVVSETDSSTSIYYSKFSFAISGEQRIMNYTALRDFARNEKPNLELDDSGKLPTITLNSIFLNPNNTNFAVNIGIFPSLGFDATIKLAKSDYLTIGHTAWGGQQLIIQRKLFNNQRTGIATGFFMERLYQGVKEECFGVCIAGFYPDDRFFIHGLGLRGFLLSTDKKKNRAFIKLNGKVGYLIEPNTVYGSVGLSVGIF